MDTISDLDYYEVDRDTWRQAGQLVADGAARGVTLEIGDCLLAALALREQCEVFTLDRDFERIPGIKLHSLRPN